MDVSTTIVIPCYNSVGTIVRAVDSALREKCPVVLVDDGSHDGSPDLVEGLNGVQVIRQQNQGAPAARNMGLTRVETEFVQFLDADDELESGKIAHQENLLRDAMSASFVCAGYEYVSRSGRSAEHRPLKKDKWIALISSKLGITSANLFRADAVREIEGWDITCKSSQEYDLMFRLLAAGHNCVVDTKILTRVYEQVESVSRRGGAQKWKRLSDLRVRIGEHLAQSGRLNDSRKKALQDTHFACCRHAFTSDPELAVKMHEDLISSDYCPCYSMVYRLVYRIFGFRRVEELRRRIR